MCDDGLFCNGVEICAGTCLAGTPPIIDDGISCTDDSCDEENDLIVNTPNDAYCSEDGWYDISDPYWVDVPPCDNEQRQDQEYRNHYCSLTEDCTYDVTDTRYVVVFY